MMQMQELVSRMINGTLNIDNNCLSTTPSRNDIVPSKRSQSSYCNVCEKQIYREGQRNQGAKRHILQYHLNEFMFECSFGDYRSRFDEGHIRTHIKQKHSAADGAIVLNHTDKFRDQVVYWYEKCFGILPHSIKSKWPSAQFMKPMENQERSNTFSPPSSSTSGTSTPDSLLHLPTSDIFGTSLSTSFMNNQVPQLPLMNHQTMLQLWIALATNSMGNLVDSQPILNQEVLMNHIDKDQIPGNEQSKPSFMIKDILE